MVLTMLGTEMLGGKGMGAVMNAAGKAADIVRLSKTPAQAATALNKVAELARAAGKADEAAIFEKAATERQAQAVKEAPPQKTDGVHIKAAYGEKTAHEKKCCRKVMSRLAIPTENTDLASRASMVSIKTKRHRRTTSSRSRNTVHQRWVKRRMESR
jgi:hypothetical protein